MTADEVIAELGLEPHVEGGHFAETHHEDAGSAIYYLLKAGERSQRHRVDKLEIWHFYLGDPLELTIGDDTVLLGPALDRGQRPQAIVPAGVWQSARPLGEYTLVGCTVAPAFSYDGFELG